MAGTSSSSTTAKPYPPSVNLNEHLAAARLNWEFLTRIDDVPSAREFGGWSAVVLFYSALHLVDAFLHANGRDHGQSHVERQTELTNFVTTRRMSQSSLDSYIYLANRSRNFRYRGSLISAQEYEELVVQDFRPLEAEVTGRLALAAFPHLPFEP